MTMRALAREVAHSIERVPLGAASLQRHRAVGHGTIRGVSICQRLRVF
jgi:hypothetical protein